MLVCIIYLMNYVLIYNNLNYFEIDHSPERADNHDHKRKTEIYKGPSLVDRRMDFLVRWLLKTKNVPIKYSTKLALIVCSDKTNNEQDNSEVKRPQDFPFRQTPSGHFKILPDQVSLHNTFSLIQYRMDSISIFANKNLYCNILVLAVCIH